MIIRGCCAKMLLPCLLLLLLTSADYDVCWHSQSRNSSESMPCGGGDIGLNVWVENDQLMIYMSKSGTFDENNLFPKMGRLRISMTPDPFVGAKFSQQLHLQDGYVEITADKDGRTTRIMVWVDVFAPVAHVDIRSSAKTMVCAAYESWRSEPYQWAADELMGNIAFRGAPFLPVVQADSIRADRSSVIWCHRNRRETFFDTTVAMEGLSAIKDSLWNPLSQLTYGGCLEGDGFKFVGTGQGRYLDTPYKSWKLQSDSSRNHRLRVAFMVEQTPTKEIWEQKINAMRQIARKNSVQRQKATQQWWHQYWDRSHVYIDTDKGSDSVSYRIGRNYQLFRYQLGCNAYGNYPTKFNGGLFTFDPSLINPQYRFDPDYRNWGGGTFTAQNQRLVYWPMLKSGDFDMMAPQFDFYLRALHNAELRTRQYWGHNGACFTEQIENFGLPIAYAYGWHRNPDLQVGYQQNQWLEHLWDTSLEFCMMILESHRYNGTDIQRYIPLVESCLTFFDEHYQWEARRRGTHALDANGHLILYPGSGAETYKLAYNSTSTIAALLSVTKTLLALPKDELSEEERAHWQGMLNRIPPISFREMDGHRTIAPAVTFSRIQNGEITQLYPVFPWGIYGIGHPDLQTAVDTWHYGLDNANQRNYVSWHQDAIFCARLGLTEEAKAITIKKMDDSGRRFPTFWGPGHDWVPDHNWGGSGMIGVQEMLMQTVDDKIYLLPAWPKEWNVDFMLHAPCRTVVECVYSHGKITKLIVTPESRKKDIVLPDFLNK